MSAAVERYLEVFILMTMPRLRKVKIYSFRNCLYTFYCLPFKCSFKVRSIMNHSCFNLKLLYCWQCCLKLASDIFMEVFKKILPQALKVCAIWNYFYIFYSCFLSAICTKLHYTILWDLRETCCGCWGCWGRMISPWTWQFISTHFSMLRSHWHFNPVLKE